MRRLFLYSFVTAFTIIGSVIGAGFVTGKEVFEFFAKDFSLSGIYLAFLSFSFTISFVMIVLDRCALTKWVDIFVSIANVIVAGCMISALNSVYSRLFCVSEKVEILSVFTAILLFVMSINGIKWLEKICLVTLPIVIVVIAILCTCKIDSYSINLSPKAYGGIAKPFIYVGFNVILSSGVIKNSGEKLPPPFKILSSVITSFILCMCVCLLSFAVKDVDEKLEMPFISLFFNNKKLLIIIDIITLFAIYSTLLSALFTINNFGGVKIGLKIKILFFLLTLFISRLGFSSIVERLYPALGVIAYLVLLLSYLLSRFSLKGQPKHTCLLRVDKE